MVLPPRFLSLSLEWVDFALYIKIKSIGNLLSWARELETHEIKLYSQERADIQAALHAA
jgi:hypothetical protein